MKKMALFYALFLLCSLSALSQSYYIASVAGTGTAGYSGDGGTATSAMIREPHQMARDASGNLYIADEDNHRIRRVDAITGAMSTLVGTGTAGHTDGPISTATIANPVGLALDASGNLFFSESTGLIRKVDIGAGTVTTVAGGGSGVPSVSGTTALGASIPYPQCLAFDNYGTLYISEPQHGLIRRIVGGAIYTYAGGGTGAGADGDLATNSHVYAFWQMAFDSYNNLYFVGGTNGWEHSVRKIDASTNVLSTVAGSASTAGFSGDGGAATSALFRHPIGICIDASDNIYVSDSGNHRVRKINTSGIITTFAGTGSASYSGDGGNAVGAGIGTPAYLLSNATNEIYLGDIQNYVVRRIRLNHAPYFLDGSTQSLVVCQNSSATSLNTLLKASDIDMDQTITWGVFMAASHGSVSGTYSTSSTGGTVSPLGFTYTPSAGYSGTDMFKIVVSDGITTSTMTFNVTVKPYPAAITGTTSACVGTSSDLNNSVGSGTWTSTNPMLAVVNSSTGLVTGVSAGTVTISYNNGCLPVATASFVVNALPAEYPLTGTGHYCPGGSGAVIGLSSCEEGITYELHNASPGTGTLVASYGPITSAEAGSSISFPPQTGLSTYHIRAINPLTGCVKIFTATMTVVTDPLPTEYSLTGSGHYCSGGTGAVIGLSSCEEGITYELHNASPGTGTLVASYGPIISIEAGSSISFPAQTGLSTYYVRAINAATGCIKDFSGSVTVVADPLPEVYNITGGGTRCDYEPGFSIGLDNSTSGIEYKLKRGSVVEATVTSSGGAVDFGTFTTAGVYTVTATNPATGCHVDFTTTATINVNASPAEFSITGDGHYCEGTGGEVVGLSGCQPNTIYQIYDEAHPSTILASYTAGATESSSFLFSSSLPAGDYRLKATNSATGCFKVFTSHVVITMDPLPAPISGRMIYCNTATDGGIISGTLASTTGGGTWSSSNTSVANINSTTGLVASGASGTATITYTIPSSCYVTAAVSVNSSSSYSIAIAESAPFGLVESGMVPEYTYCPVMALTTTNGVGSAALPVSGTTYAWTSGTGTIAAPTANTTGITQSVTSIYSVTATYGCPYKASAKVIVPTGSCSPCSQFLANTGSGPVLQPFHTITSSTIISGSIPEDLVDNIYISNTVTLGTVADPNLDMTDKVILVAPAKAINIPVGSDVGIHHSRLFTCPTATWSGITVACSAGGYGKLAIDNSSMLEYADNGVLLNNGTDAAIPSSGVILNITNTVFNNNGTGISLTYKPTGYPSSTTLPFVISENIFTGRTFGDNTASGSIYPIVWPSTSYLMTRTNTGEDVIPTYKLDDFNSTTTATGANGANAGPAKKGIAVDGLVTDIVSTPAIYYYFRIGEKDALNTTRPNLFDGLVTNGIVSTNANIEMQNNIFRNIKTSTINVFPLTFVASTPDNTSLRMNNGLGTGFGNQFYGCENLYNFTSTTATNNPTIKVANWAKCEVENIKMMLAPGTLSIASPNIMSGIAISSSSTASIINLDVNNSLFANYGMGIRLDVAGYSGPINFNGNQFTAALNSDGSLNEGYSGTDKIFGTGVYVNRSGTYSAMPGDMHIDNNTGCQVYRGVQIFALGGTNIGGGTIYRIHGYIKENMFKLKTYPLSPAKPFGIYVSTYTQVDVIGNSITGDGHLSMLNPDGSVIPGSQGIVMGTGGSTIKSNVTCNEVVKVNTGFYFSDINNTNWRSNAMEENMYGLVIGGSSTGARIGTQGSPTDPIDNYWRNSLWWSTHNASEGVLQTYISAGTPNNSKLYVRNWTTTKPQFNGSASGFVTYGSSTLLNATSTSEPDGCTGLSSTASRGINEEGATITTPTTYALYPNPTTGVINIEHSGDKEVKVRVLNAVGEVVHTDVLDFTSGSASMQLVNVATGLYLVELTNATGEKYVTKLMVQQ